MWDLRFATSPMKVLEGHERYAQQFLFCFVLFVCLFVCLFIFEAIMRYSEKFGFITVLFEEALSINALHTSVYISYSTARAYALRVNFITRAYFFQNIHERLLCTNKYS